MNICIWFSLTNQPWGGGNQFLRALSIALRNAGHKVSLSPNNCDVILINSHNAGPNRILYPGMVSQVRQFGHLVNEKSRLFHIIPSSFWKLFPRKGPAIVHRLDGVPELIRGSKTKADKIIPALNSLSDYTIFQSTYSQDSFVKCGLSPAKSRTIINGVDGDIFYLPENKLSRGKKIKLIAASWSPNPRKGFATLADLSCISNVEVYFAGRWSQGIDPKMVYMLGELNSVQLAERMRSSDAMVHAARNEPCSNAILEGLASGLPVLYLDSGGNKEIAGNYGLPITEHIKDDIDLLISNLDFFKEKVKEDHNIFLIENAMEKYLHSFTEAIKLRGII